MTLIVCCANLFFTNHASLVVHSDVVNKYTGDTPLSLKCSSGDLDWVKALINKYTDPNSE